MSSIRLELVSAFLTTQDFDADRQIEVEQRSHPLSKLPTELMVGAVELRQDGPKTCLQVISYNNIHDAEKYLEIAHTRIVDLHAALSKYNLRLSDIKITARAFRHMQKEILELRDQLKSAAASTSKHKVPSR